jgi:hypothetical protein
MTGPDAHTQDTRPAVTTDPLLGLSWHWIFWNETILTPIMIALVHFDIPWQPLPKPQLEHPAPSWRGFLYASLGAAILYIALDQGQRLDWFHSSLIIGMTASVLLLVLAAFGRHFLLPNPLVHHQFLMRRNTLLLALGFITGLLAIGRAADVLSLQIRQQAYTLAVSDNFLLLATCCVACLLVVSFMSKVPTQYRQVTAVSVEAK